jgi:DNA-binding CsgD family transcriptional regulator/tetratricopeptide (TPR) repeat protein
MKGQGSLVGRQLELQRLSAAMQRAREGAGSIVLVSGDAGVGKTRLIAELARTESDALVLSGVASPVGTPPYGAVVAALRARLRADPGALGGAGPLMPHLAVILPELGPSAAASDQPTLVEAIRGALAHLAREQPVLLVLDDLQWSDEATLELLSALADPVAELSVLVMALYRSDGLPRDHGVRRLRHELRRAGRLDELALEPLSLGDVAELLAAVLNGTPSTSLVSWVYESTQGTAFFVEELAAAMRVSGALKPGAQGLELDRRSEVPIPDTVRDAVLISASELTSEGRAAAEAAAVAGETFDLDLIGSLASPDGVAELLDRGLARESDIGTAAFRHGLTREALYADVPWMRRRALHRAIAEASEAAGAPSREVATHWLGARDGDRARSAFLRAVIESERVHAYRDGADAGRLALDMWPEGADEELRLDTLERYARCAELAGELAEAGRAWRELADVREGVDRAVAQRQLAAVLELRGERGHAFAARGQAAEGFAVHEAHGDAALELLIMANQLRISAQHGEAMALASRARAAAEDAGRMDLRLRALGVEGMARAKHGEYDAGLVTVRAALAVALERGMTVVAAELYQRLSVVLYDAADFRGAEEVLETALGLCDASPDPGVESACLTCMAYVLRERGEWRQAGEMCRELIAEGIAVWVAEGLLGAIHCFEGRHGAARRMLTSCLTVAARDRHYNMTVDSTTALARLAAAEKSPQIAKEHCRSLLTHWEDSDDNHYAIAGLRWSASFFAGQGDAGFAHECADALSRIASRTGQPDALAALACAIGETALLEGDASTAADQIRRSAELHRDLDTPFERAQVELRAGVALGAAGERELALEHLGNAYRIARKLGARPLAADAAREVSVLGESVSRRLGVRAAADADGAGLSRRELEVVRLLSDGHTNREIAEELVVSRRTVDMHVRNILRKLDCRSRVEAAKRAGEMGLLLSGPPLARSDSRP